MGLFFQIKNWIRCFRGWCKALLDHSVLVRLKKVGVFEVDELVKLGCRLRNTRGQHYGIKVVLFEHIDSLRKLKLSVEHGVYFCADVLEIDIKRVSRNSHSCLITFGDFRAAKIQKWAARNEKKFLCAKVGPYIHYANPFYGSDETGRLKARLGRMLLVFPAHGYERAEVRYDIDAFIFEVKKISSSYKSVCVSMYWHDFLDGKSEPYEAEGWEIVSAGHRSDPYFLQRQRSLIELSDMTISNMVGTHVGYCVSLGKPHYIFSQMVENSEVIATIGETMLPQLKDVHAAFAEFDDAISSKQKDIVEFYWGKSGEVEFFESCPKPYGDGVVEVGSVAGII